jgi:CelD/BcsL family acetyltransferase involved in cellulose biosynthesis
MRVEVVESHSELDALRGEWLSLEEKSCAYIYQNYDFLNVYLEEFSRRDHITLAVTTYREDGALRGLAPLCLVRKMGLRCLTWVGSYTALDHGEILWDPAARADKKEFFQQSLNVVWERFNPRISYLNKVRSDSDLYGFFRDNFRTLKKYRVGYARLNNDFDLFMRSLRDNRKKIKSDTERQIRRLREKGELQYRVVEKNDAAEIDRLLAVLYQQKTKKYKGTFITKPGYFGWIKRQAQELPSTHFSVLELSGNPIALSFGFVHKGRFTFYLPSYDFEFEKYSPGRVLLYYLVKDACSKGLEYFDFGMGNEPYKFEWATEEVEGASFIGDSLLEKLILGVFSATGRFK